MIRQAHGYLAGAVSGTVLIAIAAIGFVLLVTTQALRDWPIDGLGLGGGDDETSLSVGEPVSEETDAAGVAAAADGADAGSGDGPERRGGAGVGPTGGGAATSPAAPVSSAPTGSTPDGGGTAGGNTGGPGGGSARGGGQGGSTGGGSSPSGGAAQTVKDVVSGVDTVTGGTVGEPAVTEVADDVFDATAGPDSVVGNTVDKATETVGGLVDDPR